jgi:AMP deaminase
VGFDTVDDESLYENFSVQALKTKPKDWVEEKNPPYAYWTYYIYANLYSLNALRQSRGLNTFKFRPHCGEAGDIDHLATAYLISDGINHGLELNKSPVLTYLYYLKQIGLAMSPVSNNKYYFLIIVGSFAGTSKVHSENTLRLA